MAASQFRTEYYNEYRTYLSRLGGDNSGARNLLKRNLLRAIREELTPRQWQMIRLYYIDELNMAAIAENAQVFDFALSAADMETLDRLDGVGYSGFHPDEVPF